MITVKNNEKQEFWVYNGTILPKYKARGLLLEYYFTGENGMRELRYGAKRVNVPMSQILDFLITESDGSDKWIEFMYSTGLYMKYSHHAFVIRDNEISIY